MNPHLESPAIWHGFHQRLVTAIADELTAQVRPNYIVLLEEQIYLHELTEETRSPAGRADVALAERRGGAVQSGSATLEAPVIGRIVDALDEERLGYIEIRDRFSRELVTVIELLSPANKRPGPDREQYLSKRRKLLRSTAHLVEIDLLRAWPRMPVDKSPECDYLILVSRAERRPDVDLWPLGLRAPLPDVPVPLHSPASVALELQSLVHEVYDAAGYEDYLYETAIDPPLALAYTAWVSEVLKSASGRQPK
jgi:hypothetical protein